jgi:hypothetical protein
MNRFHRLALVGLLVAMTGCGQAVPPPALSPIPFPACGHDPVGLECSIAQDPFELPELDTSPNPNCGEDRFETGAMITSREQFRIFLSTHDLGWWVRLDTFRNEQKVIDWDRVEHATTIMHAPNAVIYQLVYSPDMCNTYTLRIRTDGRTSIYGCCGW